MANVIIPGFRKIETSSGGGQSGKNYIYKWETHIIDPKGTLSIKGMGRLISISLYSSDILLQELDGNSYNNIQCLSDGYNNYSNASYINFNKSITIKNNNDGRKIPVAIELLVEE